MASSAGTINVQSIPITASDNQQEISADFPFKSKFVVEQYQLHIYNLCYRILQNREEAEEAVQETFLRAYTKIASYDEKRPFSSWLFAIASHYCLDIVRRRQVRLNAWDTLVSNYRSIDETSPEKAMLDIETTQEVRSLLNTLPPAQRTAIVLQYWHAMSYEEIAQSLNTSVSAIKSKLFRARKLMAQAV